MATVNQSDAEMRIGTRVGGGLRRALHWISAILVLIVVYYALGTWAYYRVDDDPEFQPPQPTESGSRVVDMATALIARKTIEHA